MGAAVLAARIPLVDAVRRTSVSECGLAFDELGGPVVAVCGMTGGAGTTTIASCLARRAAAESAAPVLLTESDHHRSGLAVLARCATAHSLAELALRVSEDEIPAEPFVELAPGLRLIAAEPRTAARADAPVLCALLRDAREAHGLVVVDCGTDVTAGNPVLAQASHIIWIVATSCHPSDGAMNSWWQSPTTSARA
jgi:MinD-like ATPase involved in chromosome partitioning or flagellar assembly